MILMMSGKIKIFHDIISNRKDPYWNSIVDCWFSFFTLSIKSMIVEVIHWRVSLCYEANLSGYRYLKNEIYKMWIRSYILYPFSLNIETNVGKEIFKIIDNFLQNNEEYEPDHHQQQRQGPGEPQREPRGHHRALVQLPDEQEKWVPPTRPVSHRPVQESGVCHLQSQDHQGGHRSHRALHRPDWRRDEMVRPHEQHQDLRPGGWILRETHKQICGRPQLQKDPEHHHLEHHLQDPDLQPCDKVLQALPHGEVPNHVWALLCHPQCEVGVLLQLSPQKKKTGVKGKNHMRPFWSSQSTN